MESHIEEKRVYIRPDYYQRKKFENLTGAYIKYWPTNLAESKDYDTFVNIKEKYKYLIDDPLIVIEYLIYFYFSNSLIFFYQYIVICSASNSANNFDDTLSGKVKM